MDAGLLAYFMASGTGSRITFISGTDAAAESMTLSTHAAGDYIIGLGYNNNTTTAPALPSGWTNIATLSSLSNSSMRVAYKVAASSGETSGTWTRSDEIGFMVFRGVAGLGDLDGNAASTGLLVYGGLTLQDTTGKSIVIGFGCSRGASVTMGATVPGMVHGFTGSRICGVYTPAGVTSFDARNQNTGGVNNWYVITQELLSI